MTTETNEFSWSKDDWAPLTEMVDGSMSTVHPSPPHSWASASSSAVACQARQVRSRP